MNVRALQRLRRAQRRLELLRAAVRWWKRSTAQQKIAVLAEVRAMWPHNTMYAAVECNAYDSAEDYLAACGWLEVGGRLRSRYIINSI